jgi:hypothetical protein
VAFSLVLTCRITDEQQGSCDLAKGKVSSQGQQVADDSGIYLRNPDKPFFLETSGGARVFSHPQVIEDQANIACEFSHFLCNATPRLGFDDSDGKTSEPRDVFRAIAGAYTAAVFIEIPVQDVVAAVLDGPVAAIDGEDLLGVCFVRLSAGDAVGDVVRDLAALFFNRFSINQEGLLHVRKIEVGVEFGGGPDFTGFDPAMIRGIIRNEIRFLSILEIQLDILKESGLIAFDGEMIMGLTLQA